MAEQILAATSTAIQPTPPIEDEAETISADEYMEQYAHDFYEWVGGVVVKMSPVSHLHELLAGYLFMVFKAYFAVKSIGKVIQAPFVMRLDVTESRREPDLQIILDTNPGQFTETAMIGPADICIEIVSLESVARDYGEKFAEYEKAGVKEYWIIDPIRKVSRFNYLNEQSLYSERMVDNDGNYQAPLLPDFKLHVPTLWQEKLPDYFEIGQAVQNMVKG